MKKVNAKRGTKLHCPLEEDRDILFFSLVDYRNNYFTSSDPEKIIEFYNGFENRDQLIQWMRERPKGVHTIREVEGDKDIIVVIPTADFNGRFAKECRENIFRGLHIVFVESGVGNYYFNYAHNMNVGIKKAMEYNPKWVVVSNDDMIKIDDTEKLKKELYSLDHREVDIAFIQYSNCHSVPMYIANLTKLSFLGYVATNLRLKPYKLKRKFGVEFIYLRDDHHGVTRFAINVLFKRVKNTEFVNLVDFGIVSANFVRGAQCLFSEEFINEGEDTDFSLRAKLWGARVRSLDYKIGDYMGSSLGTGYNRLLRSLAGQLLFDKKFTQNFRN